MMLYIPDEELTWTDTIEGKGFTDRE